MNRLPTVRHKLERGASTSGLLVMAAILFGSYTLWCFLPIWTTPSRVASSLRGGIEGMPHFVSDETLHARAIKVADSVEIELSEDDIWIERWEATGERSVAVEFEIPVAISWMGEREIWRPVVAEHTWRVDEAAESQRIAANESQRRHQRESNARNTAYEGDFWSRASDECRKSTRDAYVTHVEVTYEDGRKRMIDCSKAFHNDKRLNGS